MRYVRALAKGREVYGLLEGDRIWELAGAFGAWTRTDASHLLEEVRLLAPCLPSKAVCVGLNYSDHAQEFGREVPDSPVIFLKPPSSVIGPGEAIRRPGLSRQVDFEGELAIVLGKTAAHVSPQEALGHVLGYTCANDVTARDLQSPTGQWTIAKSFDTFLPLGPWIETDVNPAALALTVRKNGEICQRSSTARLIFDPAYLVSYLSQVMTLLPGDVILTGTPSGVGPMAPGDEVTVEIQGIGRLTNPFLG